MADGGLLEVEAEPVDLDLELSENHQVPLELGELNYQPTLFQNKSLEDKEWSRESAELHMLCKATCPGVKLKEEMNSAYYIQFLIDNTITFDQLRADMSSRTATESLNDTISLCKSKSVEAEPGDQSKQSSASMTSHDHRKLTDEGHFSRRYRSLSHKAEEAGDDDKLSQGRILQVTLEPHNSVTRNSRLQELGDSQANSSFPKLSSYDPEDKLGELNYQPTLFQNKILEDKEWSRESAELHMLCKATCPGVKLKEEMNSAYYVQFLIDNTITFDQLRADMSSRTATESLNDTISLCKSKSVEAEPGDQSKQSSASMTSHDHRKLTDEGHFSRRYRSLSHKAEEVGAHVPEPFQNDRLESNATTGAIKQDINAEMALVAIRKKPPLEFDCKEDFTDDDLTTTVTPLQSNKQNLSITDRDTLKESLTRKQADKLYHYFAVINSETCRRFPLEMGRRLMKLKRFPDQDYVYMIVYVLMVNEIDLNQFKAGLINIGRSDIAARLDGNNYSPMVSSAHQVSVDSNVDGSSLVAEVPPVAAVLNKNKKYVSSLVAQDAPVVAVLSKNSQTESKSIHVSKYQRRIQICTFPVAFDFVQKNPQRTMDEADKLCQSSRRMDTKWLPVMSALASGGRNTKKFVAFLSVLSEEYLNDRTNLYCHESEKKKVVSTDYLCMTVNAPIPGDRQFVYVVCCLKEGMLGYFDSSGLCSGWKDYYFQHAEEILKILKPGYKLLRDNDGKIVEWCVKLQRQRDDHSSGLVPLLFGPALAQSENLEKATADIELRRFYPVELRDYLHREVRRYVSPEFQQAKGEEINSLHKLSGHRAERLRQLKEDLIFIEKAKVAVLLDGNNNSVFVIAILIKTLSQPEIFWLLKKQSGQRSLDLQKDLKDPDWILKVVEYVVHENSIEELKNKLNDLFFNSVSQFVPCFGNVEAVVHLQNYGQLTCNLKARAYLLKYAGYSRSLAREICDINGRVFPVVLYILLARLFEEPNSKGLSPKQSVAALFPIYERLPIYFNFDDLTKNRVRWLDYLLIIIILEGTNDTHYVTLIFHLEKGGAKVLKYWMFCDSGFCADRKEYCFNLVAPILKNLGLQVANVKELSCTISQAGEYDCGFFVIHAAKSCSAYDDPDSVRAAIERINSQDILEINQDLLCFLVGKIAKDDVNIDENHHN